jgi:hypothetical protein
MRRSTEASFPVYKIFETQVSSSRCRIYLEKSRDGIGRDAAVGVSNQAFQIDVAGGHTSRMAQRQRSERPCCSKLEHRLRRGQEEL